MAWSQGYFSASVPSATFNRKKVTALALAQGFCKSDQKAVEVLCALQAGLGIVHPNPVDLSLATGGCCWRSWGGERLHQSGCGACGLGLGGVSWASGGCGEVSREESDILSS